MVGVSSRPHKSSTDNGAINVWSCEQGWSCRYKGNTGKYKQKVSKRVPVVVTRQLCTRPSELSKEVMKETPVFYWCLLGGALIGCYTIEGAALFNSRAPSLIILFLTLHRHFLRAYLSIPSKETTINILLKYIFIRSTFLRGFRHIPGSETDRTTPTLITQGLPGEECIRKERMVWVGEEGHILAAGFH